MQANIDGGLSWSGHQALGHITTQLKSPDPAFAMTDLGTVQNHATQVASLMAGRPVVGGAADEHARGIAFGATTWAGAVGATFNPNNPLEFSIAITYNVDGFLHPYLTASQTGVNGVKANVINSSWGGGDAPAGNNSATLTLDALANGNGTLMVAAAGNYGYGTNKVTWPAAGYNTMPVAALSFGSGASPYTTVTNFSSGGPSSFYNPVTGQTINAARATVVIAAPGDALMAASYNPSNPRATDYASSLAGTSFAAPLVAGGASLLVDAGKQRFANDPLAVDGRVLKAVLMNSATKTAGWNNGQNTVGGVVRTTQSLDYSVGAGRLNLAGAYEQYLSGTTGLAGTGGGLVREVGWDFGRASLTEPADYAIAPMLLGGSTLTATLTWFADRTYTGVSADKLQIYSADERLVNLDLQVWRTSPVDAAVLVAESVSLYNTSEHLSFALPETGTYLLRVRFTGEIYDVRNEGWNAEEFAIAWCAVAAAVTLPGDYNGDGRVDAADYTVWADTFGRSGQALAADGNGDGYVDAADYTVWADHFGAGGGVPVAVPEAGVVGVGLGVALAGCLRRRR